MNSRERHRRRAWPCQKAAKARAVQSATSMSVETEWAATATNGEVAKMIPAQRPAPAPQMEKAANQTAPAASTMATTR